MCNPHRQLYSVDSPLKLIPRLLTYTEIFSPGIWECMLAMHSAELGVDLHIDIIQIAGSEAFCLSIKKMIAL